MMLAMIEALRAIGGSATLHELDEQAFQSDDVAESGGADEVLLCLHAMSFQLAPRASSVLLPRAIPTLGMRAGSVPVPACL